MKKLKNLDQQKEFGNVIDLKIKKKFKKKPYRKKNFTKKLDNTFYW